MRVNGLQVARTIEAVPQMIADLWWIGPMRARRRLRQVGNCPARLGHMHREGKPMSIGRPVDAGRRFGKGREFHDLAVIEENTVELRRSVAIRYEGDLRSIRRPAG